MNLREEAARIAHFGTRGRNPTAIQEVRAAFDSKWEGIRVVAARVLAKWGDSDSIDCLKTGLSSMVRQPTGGSAVREVALSLAPLLADADLDWAIDLYLNHAHGSAKHDLLELFTPFKPERVAATLDELAVSYQGKQGHISQLRRYVLPDSRGFLL